MVYCELISAHTFPPSKSTLSIITEKFSIRTQSYLVGHYSGLKRAVADGSKTRKAPNLIDDGPQTAGVTMQVQDD